MEIKIEKKCPFCKKIMIEDWLKLIKEDPLRKFEQCPYCNSIIWRKNL